MALTKNSFFALSVLSVLSVLSSFSVTFSFAFGKELPSRVLESPRSYGRGQTYVAAPHSEEATRLNPATLGEPTKSSWQLRFLQGDVFIGENTLDTVNDLTSLSGDSNIVTTMQKFDKKFGKRQYGRLQFTPLALRIFSFELTPFFSSNNYLDLRQPNMPEVTLSSDSLFGINLSMGRQLTKSLFLGATHEFLHFT